MARYLPPLQRKNKTNSVRLDTSSRIFPSHPSAEAAAAAEAASMSTAASTFVTPGFAALGGAAADRKIPRDGRRNNKHPRNCGFIQDNVKSLGDPVSSVYTDLGVVTTRVIQDKWWKDNTIHFPLHVPPLTKNTTVRRDYDNTHVWHNAPQTRHGANTNRQRAVGVIPINELTDAPTYLEKVSYSNHYDSRAPSNYPMRGRLRGAFIREPLHETHPAHPDNLEAKLRRLPLHAEAANAETPLTPCSAVPREEEVMDFNVIHQGRVDQPTNEMSHVTSGLDVEKNHAFELPEVTQERVAAESDFKCFYETSARFPTVEMEHYQRMETVLPILS